MIGPRYTFPLARWSRRLATGRPLHLFGEGLFGGVYGYDSAFPTSSGTKDAVHAYAMQAGGGLDISLGRGFGLRAPELYYIRSTLPNGATNTQHDFRLAFGISYHIPKP